MYDSSSIRGNIIHLNGTHVIYRALYTHIQTVYIYTARTCGNVIVFSCTVVETQTQKDLKFSLFTITAVHTWAHLILLMRFFCEDSYNRTPNEIDIQFNVFRINSFIFHSAIKLLTTCTKFINSWKNATQKLIYSTVCVRELNFCSAVSCHRLHFLTKI